MRALLSVEVAGVVYRVELGLERVMTRDACRIVSRFPAREVWNLSRNVLTMLDKEDCF